MLSKVLAIGLVALVLTGARNTSSLSAESCETEYSTEAVVAVDPVKVSLGLLKALPDRWELEVTVENVSNHSVFVMSEPITADGSKRPYVSVGDAHSLEIGIGMYPLPYYFVDPNETRVRLENLPPGGSRKEVFSVSLPLVETMPPYGEEPKRSKIDHKQLQFIRASVGILPDDEGIKYLLARKPFGPFVTGVEQLTQGENKGKRLIELQTVYSSSNISLPQSGTVEITYIANEGVLIASGGKQILIDGLHREYAPDYAFLPRAERETIEAAKAPFDRIDLILVSHRHLDHFHPESVGLHLQHNPKAHLVSSQQVVDELQNNFKDFQTIKARVTVVNPRWKEKVTMKAAGVDLEILGLRHGTGRHATIQNLGHVIKIGGKKLLHIGDADTAIENFDKLDLQEEQIDIALLPFWFLVGAEGQTVVREHIKPKQIIALHISPAESEKVAGQIKQAFPGAVSFTRMLEKKVY